MRRFICRVCGEIFDVEEGAPLRCPVCQQTLENLIEVTKPATKRIVGKEAMDKLSYGMYLLSAKDKKGRDHACIINSVLQVNNAPDRFLMILDKGNATYGAIDRTNQFNLSVLTQKTPFSLFYRFGFQSGKMTDKMTGFDDYNRAVINGLIYIKPYANAYFAGKIVQMIDLGTHALCLCDILYSRVLNSDPSATYEYYLNNIKPKMSLPPQPEKDVWRCTSCGFEFSCYGELPKDICCPMCQKTYYIFEKRPKISLVYRDPNAPEDPDNPVDQ